MTGTTCLIDPVPWEGISETDREALEKMAQTFACSVDVLRLAFRFGVLAGADTMLNLVAMNPEAVISA